MGRKQRINVGDVKISESSLMERDKQIFIDWLNGLTAKQIAEKHGMSKDNVYRLSQKYNWRDKRKQINARYFEDTIDKINRISYKSTNLLYSDIERIQKKFESGTEPLTAEERAHLRGLLDRILKERRLEEGKPTEISDTPVKIILPAGVKDFGIIPTTAHSVKVIETEQEIESEPDFSVDDIEANTDDEDND
jgi:hypothetical protein